ncbi:MAG: hypothetical protein ACI379_08405 [Nocardioides sp.]|uniref:hypothetical protein n=1 Tax=Nocardioides sp. TaxID=35761 RepID=UPI003EFFE87F
MPESRSTSEAPAAASSDSAAGPPRTPVPRRALPSRRPDARRPKVQGLNPGASELRRRQTTAASSAPPSDEAHLAVLLPWAETLRAVLRSIDTEHDGFATALVCTAAGSPVAHHGIESGQVAVTAAGTSALHGTASALTGVDHVRVHLSDGTAVVVADVGTPETPLLLRLSVARGVAARTLSGVLRGTRQDLADSVRDAESAARPSRVD